MKKLAVILFICLISSGGFAQKSQSVSKLNKELKQAVNLDSVLQYEIKEVNRLYDRSVYFRDIMVDFSNQLYADQEMPLGAKNLNFIKSNTNVFMALRDSLYTYTYKYEKAMNISQAFLKKQNITELQRTKAVMLSTACALILYDNYLTGVVLLEQDTRVRRAINEPDIGFGVNPNQLYEISKAANSIKNQNRIIKGIKFLERREKLFAKESDEEYLYLRDLIYASPSRDYLKRTENTGVLRKKFQLTQLFITDYLTDVGNNNMNDLSKLFGNTTGMVATRTGIMYKDSLLKQEILNELQPLDILLEKTPFRLTDKFIPGYFGHAAIWVGNGADLDSLGVWNHKVVRKHQAKIAPNGEMKGEEGTYIIEALREGVKLSTLDEFMNVDDFVILRPVFKENPSEKQKKESLLLAFRQLGKEYDFNFDINTTKKIVCSELAYISFPRIDWITEKVAGRHTISPDNIATLVWESGQMEVVAFYRNGIKCKTEEQEMILKQVVLGEQ